MSIKFGDRLRTLRESKPGLTQEALGKLLGVTKNAVSMWERNERSPLDDTMYEKIADFFNVDYNYLLGKEAGSTYYLDPKTAELAQKLSERPKWQAMFDAGKDLPEEQLEEVKKFIEYQLSKEKHNNDE